jgi:HTH-type transcriptional regulator/antitoxin HigA
MTLTFNPESYVALLAQYQPKVITTEAENEKVIAIVEDLEHRSHLTPEEKALLELLVTLISKFEEENYPNGNRKLTEKEIQDLAVFFQINPSYLCD